MPLLLIMRHASAADPETAASDFDRPLTQFGQETAEKTGTALQQAGILVDCVVTSAALRTLQTARTLAAAFTVPPKVEPLRELYNASAREIEFVIQQTLLEEPACLLIVGHNPGIAAVMCRRAGRSLAVPPATLAIFQADSHPELRGADGGGGHFVGVYHDGVIVPPVGQRGHDRATARDSLRPEP